MLVKEGKLIAVSPPLEPTDAPALNLFKVGGWGTVMYVPFDPETFQIPSQVLSTYKEKVIGDIRVRYSPNVHRIFLQYYVKTDEQGRQYATMFPVLLVDYKTATHLLYAGLNKPEDRPLETQYREWKSGVMWGRYPSSNLKTRQLQVCTRYDPVLGCMDLQTVVIPDGYYWVGYEARLLDMPFTTLTADRDVFKFYYKKPEGIVYKIPGFSSVAEYVYERKIKGQIDDIQNLLAGFGLALDPTPYTTDSGKAVTGPYVEETKDGYVVYMPVRRVGGLGLPIPGYIVALILVALIVATVCVTFDRMESRRSENFKYYLNFVQSAMDSYDQCVESCGGDPACVQRCAEVYAKAVNTAEKAFQKTGTGFTETIGELTDLLKWGIAAVVVINLLPVITSAAKSVTERGER